MSRLTPGPATQQSICSKVGSSEAWRTAHICHEGGKGRLQLPVLKSCDQNLLFSLVNSGGNLAGNSTNRLKNAEPSISRALSMKLMTPEIVWHSKEPVFSADFHRRGPNWRLATGGADNDIKVTRKLYVNTHS